MPAPLLVSAIRTFTKSLEDARDIAEDAREWSVPKPPATTPLISIRRRDTITETAFLRAFTAWEVFLEETFILYLLGYRAPRGRVPRRYGFPPSRAAASEWCADGKEYAKWNPADVQRRADRWFQHGMPFTPALQGQQHRLNQLITIRNAIAHVSSSAHTKFEGLVRQELTALPPNTTVGNFLLTVKPGTAPPQSFMEFYLGQIEQIASNIVPR